MSNYEMGFICGFITVFVLIAVITALRRKRGVKIEYDERQLIARNAAYKYSFFTLIIYCILCGMLDVLSINWAILSVQMFLGIFISVTVCVVICIYKDAYFGIEKNKNSIYYFVFLSCLIIFVNMFSFVSNFVYNKNSFISDGMLNENVVNPMCAGAFLIMMLSGIIKIIINKKECSEEWKIYGSKVPVRRLIFLSSSLLIWLGCHGKQFLR